jgi:hypothetical protein
MWCLATFFALVSSRERGHFKVAKISAGSSATRASAEVFSSLPQPAIEEPSPAESSMDERTAPHDDITDLDEASTVSPTAEIESCERAAMICSVCFRSHRDLVVIQPPFAIVSHLGA